MHRVHPDLILGTAGHIDHGKSALVKALTGTDPDRLAEEKRRGITIQLGFARIELPDGRAMGVVDVPGHEKFVRQMIAGATGVDVALLVIAADDGIMPQTVEHLAVLQTLGIGSCVVALTKADLVEEDWLEFVKDEVSTFLDGTAYADAPVVAVSSKTGAGLDELLLAIQAVSDKAAKVQHGPVARLPVDRVFTIKGAGTVVTGTLWGGTVASGDVLETLPGKRKSRVRSVQIHGEATDAARPGNRVALNLADLSTEEVAPGDMLATPGQVALSDRFDCRFTYIDTAKTGKPLLTGSRMHIAHGTREVLGRVLFCDGTNEVAPGEDVFAQIRLEKPLPMRSGDRFIVRTYSPVHVAGGGTVLLTRPRRRTNLKAGERELFEMLVRGDRAEAAVAAAALQPYPVSAARIATYIGTDEDSVTRALEAAAQDGRLVKLGTAGFTTSAVRQRLASRIEGALIEFHSGNPAETGMALESLRRACAPQVAADTFRALVDDLGESGAVVVREGQVGHPSAQGSAQRIVDNAADALASLLAKQGMTPETLDYLGEHAGLDGQMTAKAASALVKAGRAYRVSADLIFDAATIEAAKQAVRTHITAGGAGTVAALKDAMGTTRKYAVPLLEAFDAEGFTVRSGDERTLGATPFTE